MAENSSIERLILIGMITSREYLQEIVPITDLRYLESDSGRRLASWVLQYWETYQQAPRIAMEGIYLERLKKDRLKREDAEDIAGILETLSEDWDEERFNLPHLITQTREYFTERKILLHLEEVRGLIEVGKSKEAEQRMLVFQPILTREESTIRFSNQESLSEVERAFREMEQPLFRLPKQLGKFMDDQLIRGGFIAFLSPEKRGKSFLLLALSILALQQRCRVAFFQAGDMTERQQIRRFAIRLARLSDKEKYCEEHFEAVRDCIHNQRDTCDRACRECSQGVFEGKGEDEIRKEITRAELIQAWKDNPHYRPCWNCHDYQEHQWGAVWIKQIPRRDPLEAKKATQVWERFFIQKRKQLYLSTYVNGTLSVKEMQAVMDRWKRNEDWQPDIIIIDYADLLTDSNREERHRQNQIWKDLRALSQSGNQPLIITATQSDADSYEKNSLRLKNFSEDKRKYAHVTAMYGINQDPKGREKQLGIVRLNELLLREGEFETSRELFLTQNLRRGLPFTGSFF